MSLAGWWKRRREMKCARVGHRERRVFVRGYTAVPLDHWNRRRLVAMEAGKTTTVCTRCGRELDRKVEIYCGLHGLSLPTDLDRQLDETGEVWLT